MTTEWDKDTTNGKCEDFLKENPNAGAPCPIDPATGQYKSYWVLPEEERKKGFVRPYRESYKHLGMQGPKYPLRDLTEDERKTKGFGYIKFEKYTELESPIEGRLWTREQLDRIDKGCQTVTTMGRSIAETYARNPNYYGGTFCCFCKAHFPVSEFVWLDGSRVGT